MVVTEIARNNLPYSSLPRYRGRNIMSTKLDTHVVTCEAIMMAVFRAMECETVVLIAGQSSVTGT
jgi:hypothetical protein